jgi:hypothetical protein
MRRILKTLVILYLVSEAVWLTLMWSWFYSTATVARPWAGPWKAQVVDVETNQPLAGVVVLAWWDKSRIVDERKYIVSEEVVTGPDGRFAIQQRWCIPLIPFVSIVEGPRFTIFKPGYGQWHFRGDRWSRLSSQERLKTMQTEFEEQNNFITQAWAQFEGEGVTIELPPLKSREERRRFYLNDPSSTVPPDRMRRLKEALDKERNSLLGR